MSRQRRFKSTDARSEQQACTIDSPYLTSKEALVYLRLPSLSSLYSHIRENRLPVCRVVRDLRFDKRELDAWVKNFGSAIEMVRATRKVS